MFDLHIHSNYSDGTDDVETIINKIAKTDIKYFSITDHDIALSAREIFSNEKLVNLIKKNGLTYVTGIEFTCRFDGYKMHILGYDYNPNLQEIKEFENEIKKLLKEKDNFRNAELQKMGYIFSEKSVKFLNSRKNVRKLDVANCLVNDGYFSDTQEAIKNILNNIKYPKSYRLDCEKVIKTLSNLGVKMVWAHSLHGINEKSISFDEVDLLVSKMKKFGLLGLECYYSLYNNEEIEKLLSIAKKYNLFVTCGSDYHGKNKYVKLAEISCDGTIPQSNEIQVQNLFTNVVK